MRERLPSESGAYVLDWKPPWRVHAGFFFALALLGLWLLTPRKSAGPMFMGETMQAVGELAYWGCVGTFFLATTVLQVRRRATVLRYLVWFFVSLVLFMIELEVFDLLRRWWSAR